MTTGQKIALSLLTTLLLFSAFLLVFNYFVFENLEAKFYKQARIQESTVELNQISQNYNDYFNTFLDSVSKDADSWVNLESVRSFYDQNPSEFNVAGRRTATESLFKKYQGLNGIRIIDKNGTKVHFSTFDETDVLQQKGVTKTYKNYQDVCKTTDEISFSDLEKICSSEKPKILFDDLRSRILVSVPSNYTENIFSGYALFYFNFDDLQSDLMEKNQFEQNYRLTLFADSDFTGGLVQGVPDSEKSNFKNTIIDFWNKNPQITENKIPQKLVQVTFSEKKDDFWVALSDTNGGIIRVLGVYKNAFFEISKELRLVIYLCIFISLFLVLFLVFSLKRDSMTVLKKKVKKIQLGIIQDCFESGEKINLENLSKKLESRKNDFSREILKSLHITSKKKQITINKLLKKNWDEIFALFQTQLQNQETVSENKNAKNSQSQQPQVSTELIEEIRTLLKEVLQNTPVKASAAANLQELGDAEELEGAGELEELGEAEELEGAGELEELGDAEELEGAGELEELGDAEELEGASEPVELGDAEELSDAGELEELGEAEELSDASEPEELGDAEELEGASEPEELGDAEELEGTGELEELGDAEELSDASEPEELGDAEELEGAGEPGELGDAEDLNDAGELEELGDAEELEGAGELEELGDFELVDLVPLEDVASIRPFKEPLTFQKLLDSAFLNSQPHYVFSPTNETYFSSEDFATVDNIFAEEICLGSGVVVKNDIVPIDFKLYQIEKSWTDNAETPAPLGDSTEQGDQMPQQGDSPELGAQTEDDEPTPAQDVQTELGVQTEPSVPSPFTQSSQVEELIEEVPASDELFYYSMTQFAENLSQETPMLDAAEIPQDAIVQEDGIYIISKQTDYKNVSQDKDFKSLVDSIL